MRSLATTAALIAFAIVFAASPPQALAAQAAAPAAEDPVAWREWGAQAVDEARIADSKCLIADHPEVAARMREVAGKIIDGSLELEDPMFAK